MLQFVKIGMAIQSRFLGCDIKIYKSLGVWIVSNVVLIRRTLGAMMMFLADRHNVSMTHKPYKGM